MADHSDTIFALSSGRVPAAIAVVRMSGPHARFGLETLMGRVPEPRRATLARLRDPATQDLLDQCVVLWFPGPRSETGEDVAELQLHGGPAVVAGVLAALGRLPGFRPAEAGEFTRRAFENGQLDLTAVEGLADLVGAETQAQRRQALLQLRGQLGQRADAWRKELTEALALVEAGIDFSDEGDVPLDLGASARAKAAEIADQIGVALADDRRGERLRDGLVIAIAGPPNAGKSSLLNRLAQREAAIVSPYAGTTRDVIEVHMELDGYPVTLVDTAGIREAADPVEQEGVRRARARVDAADLVLWLRDAGGDANASVPQESEGRQLWQVWNKIDLIDSDPQQEDGEGAGRVFRLSAKTGAGLDGLIAALSGYAADAIGSGEGALITRARHRHHLSEARAALLAAQAPKAEELLAEDLRVAAAALGRLTGRIDVEQILDVIFRDFCIGK